MKYVYSFKRLPYLIDDQQKKHSFRPLIHGICIGPALLLSSWLAPMIIKSMSISLTPLRLLIFAILYLSICYIVAMGLAWVFFQFGKSGCLRVFNEKRDDEVLNQ